MKCKDSFVTITHLFLWSFIFVSCVKKPQSSFTYDKSTAITGSEIAFTNLSVNADRYEWDFGDGTNSTEISPKKYYEFGGNYTVNLTAYNGIRKEESAQSLKVLNLLDVQLNLKGTNGAKHYFSIKTSNGAIGYSLRVDNVIKKSKLPLPLDSSYVVLMQNGKHTLDFDVFYISGDSLRCSKVVEVLPGPGHIVWGQKDMAGSFQNLEMKVDGNNFSEIRTLEYYRGPWGQGSDFCERGGAAFDFLVPPGTYNVTLKYKTGKDNTQNFVVTIDGNCVSLY